MLRALVVVAAVLLMVAPAAGFCATPEEPDTLILFWGNGCPHCANEREFLVELSAEFPDLPVVQYEVWYDEANQRIFVETMAAIGREPRAVPTTVYGDLLWEGFAETTAEEMHAAVAAAYAADDAPEPPPAAEDPGETIDVPLVGDVAVGSESLIVSTLAISFVDGFNPCSLWVLSMLLALVLHTKSRRRVLAVGLVFLAVTTLLYGFYIAGVYSILSYVAYVSWIRVAVAVIALTFGLLNLKDFLWSGEGPSLGIAERHKPRLYRRMRSVAVSDRPLPQVLGGTAALAVGVSLIETPCTAGFPLMWSNLLADANVGLGAAVALFALYMVVFLIDELAILGVAVAAMRVTKLQEQHGRVLRLVGGMVMVALAFVMLFQPELMESVTGAIVVFVAAAAMAALAFGIDRVVRSTAARRTPHRPRRA
jgi:cytochrome c biogenesis protein CcdA